MKFLEVKVVRKTKKKNILARSKFLPKIYSPVYYDDIKIGYVSDIIGNINDPLIMIRVDKNFFDKISVGDILRIGGVSNERRRKRKK